MKVLAADGLEVEDALEGVGDGDGDEDGEREEPQGEIDDGGDTEEAMAGLDERAPHRMAWLPRPRQIPKHPTGKRRRNGHTSSFGRRMSSYSCKR